MKWCKPFTANTEQLGDNVREMGVEKLKGYRRQPGERDRIVLEWNGWAEKDELDKPQTQKGLTETRRLMNSVFDEILLLGRLGSPQGKAMVPISNQNNTVLRRYRLMP